MRRSGCFKASGPFERRAQPRRGVAATRTDLAVAWSCQTALRPRGCGRRKSAETAWRGREGGHVCSSAAFHSGASLSGRRLSLSAPRTPGDFGPLQVPPASQTSMRPVPSLDIAWAASGDGHVCSAHLAMALSPFGPPPGDRCTSVSYLYLRQSVFAGRSRGNLSATSGLRQVRHSCRATDAGLPPVSDVRNVSA
jgi:hypothetical protein